MASSNEGLNLSDHCATFNLMMDEVFSGKAIAAINESLIAISDSASKQIHFHCFEDMHEIIREHASCLTFVKFSGEKHRIYFHDISNQPYPGRADAFIAAIRHFVGCTIHYNWFGSFYYVERLTFDEEIPPMSLIVSKKDYIALFERLSADSIDSPYNPLPLEYYAQFFFHFRRYESKQFATFKRNEFALYTRSVAKSADKKPPFHIHCKSSSFCPHISEIKNRLGAKFDVMETIQESAEE